jgi:hypothetical protein
MLLAAGTATALLQWTVGAQEGVRLPSQVQELAASGGAAPLRDGFGGSASRALATGTPIIDPHPTSTPTPVPQPIYLTFLAQHYDPLAPGAVPASATGYVAKLDVRGRIECAPATHVLLDAPEGELGARAVSLLYRSPNAPALNLDLYVGDYVEAAGLVSLAPERCRSVCWQLMEVSEVREREIPPRARVRAGAD